MVAGRSAYALRLRQPPRAFPTILVPHGVDVAPLRAHASSLLVGASEPATSQLADALTRQLGILVEVHPSPGWELDAVRLTDEDPRSLAGLFLERIATLLGHLDGRSPAVPEASRPPFTFSSALEVLAESSGRDPQVVHELASVVFGVPLISLADRWTVNELSSWVDRRHLVRLQAVPIHFDGRVIHYATSEVPTPAQATAVAHLFGCRESRSSLVTRSDYDAAM